MNLGELISILEGLPADAKVGLSNPHSYRGYYEQLAFEPCEPRPVADVLTDARACVGAVFEAYKGGEYRMGLKTIVNCAKYGELNDDELTPAFFGIRNVAALEAELAERDSLWERLHELLRGVALGLFGPEPELVRYDLSHLPRIAAEVRAAGIEVVGEHPDRKPVNRRAEELSREVERLRTALSEVNDIRNSIIGAQALNWSEHAYPLVAVLDRAGFEGLPYPEARQHVGTLLERLATAEQQVAKSFDDATATEALIVDLMLSLRALVAYGERWFPDHDDAREALDKARASITNAAVRP